MNIVKDIEIRVEEVDDHPDKKSFYRVIINKDGKLKEIIASKNKPQILKYKSKIIS